MTPEAARRFVFEQSVPARAFFGALHREEILLSHATFRELGNVLRREKFDRYLTVEDREQFLLMLVRDASIVDVPQEIHECRDPKTKSSLTWRLMVWRRVL